MAGSALNVRPHEIAKILDPQAANRPRDRHKCGERLISGEIERNAMPEEPKVPDAEETRPPVREELTEHELGKPTSNLLVYP